MTVDVTTREIGQIQDRFDLAELQDDRDTLQYLIDDAFVSIGPKGYVLDKHQWISRHEFFTYHELDVSDIDILVFGDTAIVRGIQRNHATSSGREVRINTRASQVWILRKGTWRLAGIQFSPLAEDQ